MNISQLQYFVAAAQSEHFGIAAKSLYITQPALSNSISRLERELGVKLFSHSGRNVKLTPSGELFLKHVSRSLSELNEAVRLVTINDKVTSRAVKVGAVAAVLRGYLSSLVSSCEQLIDGSIVLDIFQKGSTADCINGILDGSLDLAFCGKPINQERIRWVPLLPQNAVATLSVKHPLADQVELSLSEIKEYPQLSYREPSYMYYAFQDMFKQYGLNPRAAFEDEISALSVIAANVNSIGIMLDSISDVIWEELRVLPITELNSTYHYIGMAYKEGLPYSDEIRSLISYIIKASENIDFEEPIESLFYK